jgi:hypothetical protein
LIPAILAAPMVQGVVGGVVGSVMNMFAPSTPTAPAAASSASFGPMLQRMAQSLHNPAASASPGMKLSSDWSQMSATDAQTWLQSLSGRHVDATDAAGHSISGTVNGVSVAGHTLSLNIGGQLVSLSNLKQISWSAATV